MSNATKNFDTRLSN